MRLARLRSLVESPAVDGRVCQFVSESGVEGRAFLRHGHGETSYDVSWRAASGPCEMRWLGTTGCFSVTASIVQIIGDDEQAMAVAECLGFDFWLELVDGELRVGDVLQLDVVAFTIWSGAD